MKKQLEALKLARDAIVNAQALRPCEMYKTALAAVSAAIADAEIPVMDLNQTLLDSMIKAASESKWIPHEHYYMNDWVADVCEYLRNGHTK